MKRVLGGLEGEYDQNTLYEILNYKYYIYNKRAALPLAEHVMLWVLGRSTVCLR